MESMWTIGDVMAYLQVTKETVERLVKNGDFPKPVSVGPRLVRWRYADIAIWESGLDSDIPVRVVFTKRFPPFKVGESAELSEHEAAILLVEDLIRLVDQTDVQRIAEMKVKLTRQRARWVKQNQEASVPLGLLKDWNGVGRAAHLRDRFPDHSEAPHIRVRFLQDWDQRRTGQECSLSMEHAATLSKRGVVEMVSNRDGWTRIDEA